MSHWNHSICDVCWSRLYPDREPVTIVPDYRHVEQCCYCGGEHCSGIYFRAEPQKLHCQGKHPEEEPKS